MDTVVLELFCGGDDNVSVALHAKVNGTPCKSFGPPHPSASPARRLEAETGVPEGDANVDVAACGGIGLEEPLTGGSGGGSNGSGPTANLGAALMSSPCSQSQEAPQHDESEGREQQTTEEPCRGSPFESSEPLQAPAAAPGSVPEAQVSVPAVILAMAEQQDAAREQPTASPEAGHTVLAATPTPASSAGDAGALDAVMGLLQQLLAGQNQGAAVQLAPCSPAAAAQPARHHELPATPRVVAASGGGRGLPGGVEKLLALELEVVQLQQSLQIAQLEFEARTVQLLSLKQRAERAEQSAASAEERAARLGHQSAAAERAAAELRAQLGNSAARHQAEAGQLRSQLADAAARADAAEAAAAGLRQAQAAADGAQAAARRDLCRAASEAAELREQAAALSQDNQQLRVHVSAACGALKALGIPVHRVFSRSALLLAGHSAAFSSHSPPESPAGGVGRDSVYHSPASASASASASETASLSAPQQAAPRPAQVPRLQLSSVTLEQLALHAAQPVAAVAAPAPAQQAGAAAAPVPSQQGSRTAEGPLGATSPAAEALQPASGEGMRAQDLAVVARCGHPQRPSPLGPLSPADTTAASPAPLAAGGRRVPVALPRLQLPLADAADAPPLLTARATASPAQQELLATARQWQLSARSARSAAPEAEAAEHEGHGLIPAYRPPSRLAAAALPASIQLAQQAPATARPSRPAWEGTPPRLRRAPSSAHGTPAGKAGLQRRTYGQEPGFQEIKEAYNAVVAAEAADRARSWARSAFSSASAVESDPRKVEPVVQGLLQLFAGNGVAIPLAKCGPAQYRLGQAKLAVRLVNGRLVARAGAGQTTDVLRWLERQPVRAPR